MNKGCAILLVVVIAVLVSAIYISWFTLDRERASPDSWICQNSPNSRQCNPTFGDVLAVAFMGLLAVGIFGFPIWGFIAVAIFHKIAEG